MIDRWHSALSDEQIRTFADDGVLHVPGAVDADVVAEIAVLADQQLAEPGPWVTATATDPLVERRPLASTRVRRCRPS